MTIAIALGCACGGKGGDDRASAGSGSASAGSGSASAGSGSASASGSAAATAPLALGSDGLPVACAEWRAALDKLATCDAFPANARESLTSVYTDASKSWGQLPPDAKRRLGAICQAGTDSIMKGAKATCGW